MTVILVVEDDEVNQEVVGRFLRREGYRVLMAGDGAKAVEMAREQKPGLILMDLSLPTLDGWEATRRIRADPVTANIPIIALTAHTLPADVIRAREAGCDAYEVKPLLFSRLRSKIEGLMGAAGG